MKLCNLTVQSFRGVDPSPGSAPLGIAYTFYISSVCKILCIQKSTSWFR